MASGSRLFSDSAALRNIPYPGNFSAEFMFRGPTNPFSQVQFVPERIVEFSISPEGIRFYKVEWQETWLPEHHLMQYQNLIDIFWQNQSKQSSVCGKSDQPPHSTSISGGVQTSTSGGVQTAISGGVQTAISGGVQTAISSNSTQPILPNPPHSQAPIGEKSATTKSEPITNLNNVNSHTSDRNVIQHTQRPSLHQIVSDQSKQDPNIIRNAMVNAANKNITGCSDDFLNLPNAQITMNDSHDHSTRQATPSDEGNKYNNENELTKVVSQVKKNKSMSIQLEGFELVNIENTSATEEELKLHAQELLRSFSKRLPRCPTGATKLPLTCFFCQTVVPIRKGLREHQLRRHFKNAGEFVCSICQKRFLFRRQLKAHVVTHTDNRNFVCNICGLTCKRRNHLHAHMKKHKKECNYRCDVCHKNFKVQADLKEHCLNEHKNQINKCNVCKQTLQTPYSVYVHSMRHSGTREHCCKVCKATFKSKHHLTTHEKIHTKLTESFKCPACDKEFPDTRSLQKHIQLFHQELAEKYRYEYICSICDKDFAYKGRLDEHMKMHEEETEEERKQHAVKASRKKGKVETMSEEALNELRDQVEKITNPETGEVKLSCKLCRRREFKLVGSMENHLEEHKAGFRFHVGKKVLPKEACEVLPEEACEVLPKEACLPRKGTMHQVSSKPNSFQCRMCKSSFKWKSCLQSHMKKCASISKGASKRKATLKAKERFHRKIEDASSDDEICLIQQENDFNMKRGASSERKATLKAKQTLRIQIEDALSDDEICIIHLEEKYKIKKGENPDTLRNDCQSFSNQMEIEQNQSINKTASVGMQDCNGRLTSLLSNNMITEACPEDIIKSKEDNISQEIT